MGTMLSHTSKNPQSGKWYGKPLHDVPADYLLWCVDNSPTLPTQLFWYVNENIEMLKLEIKTGKNKRIPELLEKSKEDKEAFMRRYDRERY